MRLRLAFLAALTALIAPASAQAANLFVVSGADNTNSTTQANSIGGLVSLSDNGGEFQQSASGGAVIAGSGVGPYVYNSGGTGSIRQFSGGTYTTITNSIPSVRSMTVTGRGLVVAIGDKLQYVSGTGARSDVAHGTLTGGDSWVAIATAPNGHLIGWSWFNGWGKLWDLNLGDGTTTSQDYTGTANDPFFNNRDNVGTHGAGPVGNAGDIAVDGQGGLWVANAEGDGSHAQIYYGPSGGSLNSVGSNYYKPHVTATGDGIGYASSSDYTLSPYISEVNKFTPTETGVTTNSSKLENSAIFDLAIDRCYTSGCAVSFPSNPGGTGGGSTGTGSKGTGTGTGTTGKTSSPLKTVLSSTPTSAAVTSKGLGFKVKCKKACSVSVGGSLVFGKPKGKGSAAIAAASTKLAAKKFKLKAGKATTITLKLSKSQRKAIKKAKKKKQKVSAKLKVKVTPKGGKAVSQTLTLKVK